MQTAFDFVLFLAEIDCSQVQPFDQASFEPQRSDFT